MKVILLDNIKGVGKKDEVINASDGYARNFLFPKNLAVEANKENMAKLQAKKDSKQHQKDLEKEGLATSRQGEIDKRCRMMSLTEKGKAELSAFLKTLNSNFDERNTEIEHALDVLSIYLNKKI